MRKIFLIFLLCTGYRAIAQTDQKVKRIIMKVKRNFVREIIVYLMHHLMYIYVSMLSYFFLLLL